MLNRYLISKTQLFVFQVLAGVSVLFWVLYIVDVFRGHILGNSGLTVLIGGSGYKDLMYTRTEVNNKLKAMEDRMNAKFGEKLSFCEGLEPLVNRCEAA